jgi:hypothetical protein
MGRRAPASGHSDPQVGGGNSMSASDHKPAGFDSFEALLRVLIAIEREARRTRLSLPSPPRRQLRAHW